MKKKVGIVCLLVLLLAAAAAAVWALFLRKDLGNDALQGKKRYGGGVSPFDRRCVPLFKDVLRHEKRRCIRPVFGR